MTWPEIRAYYVQQVNARQLTQESIARRGGLRRQNLVSRMLTNQQRGPTVDTFIRAIYGLGLTPAAFFAEVEAAAAPDRRSDVPATIVPSAAPASSRTIEGPQTFPEVVAARFAAIEHELDRLNALTHDLGPTRGASQHTDSA